MFGFQMPAKPVQTEALEAKSEALAAVLNEFKVFGDVDGKWLESEVRGFKSMVRSHALEERSWNYLELTYHYNCVRLIITTAVVDGEAAFREVTAHDHPWKSEKMDYEGLNAAIQEVLAQ